MRKRDPKGLPDGRGRRGTRDRWVTYALAPPLAVVMIAPFLYMVATALMSEPDSLRHPIPDNFSAALVAAPFGRFLLNSAIFSLAVVAGQVLTSATAAYAFARLRFPGRDRVFLAYLCPLMAPAIVLVTGIIGAFQVLAFVMVLTGGGPLGATDVIVYRIYRTAWELLQFGDASAMALLLFAVLFGVTWVQLKLLDRRVEHA